MALSFAGFKSRQDALTLRSVAAACGIGIALAGLPLKAAALVSLAVPVGVVVALWPQISLFSLPLLVPLDSAATLAVGGTHVGLVEVGVGVLTVSWLARSVIGRQIRLHLGPVGGALLLWVWATGLSLLVAVSLKAGLAEAAKWAEVLLVFAASLALLRCRQLRYLVYGVSLAGVFSALLGLYQFASGRGPEGFLLFGRFMRAYGTFAQPNPFAGHLGLSLPFALSWAMVAGRASKAERLAMLGAAGVMALGILASWSRGAWVATAVAVALMLALAYPGLAVGALTIALLLGPFLGSGVAASPLVQRALGMGGDIASLNVAKVIPSTANFALVERLAHWQAGWYMFAAHPWLGVGIGNYESAYPGYALSQWPAALGHAHNFYLNVAAECGLVGLITYFVLGAVAWSVAVRAWRLALEPELRAALLAAMGSLAYLSVHNLVDDLYVHGMQVLVGISLALVAVAWSSKETSVTIGGVQCR